MKKISIILLATVAGSIFGWEFEFKNMTSVTYNDTHAVMNTADQKHLGISDKKSWEKVKMTIESDAVVIDTRECFNDTGKYMNPYISVRAVKPADLKLGDTFNVKTTLEAASAENKGRCMLRYWGPVKDAPAISLKNSAPVDGKPLILAGSIPEGLQALEVNIHFESPAIYTLKKITVDSVAVEK